MNRELDLLLKRMLDFLISVILLMVLTPLIIVISLIIKLTTPGPVFFTQRRVGRNGVIFKIIKFRTMQVDEEMEQRSEKHRVDSANDQERMTRVGRILRRLKLDEIPQLINVLKGDMSLVGPRPTFERQVLKYTDHQRKRLLMRPGMTGLAQVKGGTSLTWEERINYDIDYIENYSLWLDFLILIKTFLIVLLGEKRFKKHYRKYNNKTGLFLF